MKTYRKKIQMQNNALTIHRFVLYIENIQLNIFFLVVAQNIDYGYMLKPPHQGSSNEYPQSIFLYIKIRKEGVSLLTPVLFCIQGCKGAFIAWTCLFDGTTGGDFISCGLINEPPHGKTNNLHRRKQKRRSASR